MSKRYGRNQRRLARVKIAQLEARLEQEHSARLKAEASARINAARASDAYNQAFQSYAQQHGMLEAALSRMSHELGHALGEKLIPHAERLMASSRQREPFRPSFTARLAPVSHTVQTIELRGEIPSLAYHMQIADW